MLLERILHRLLKEQPDDWEAAARKRRDAIFRQMMGVPEPEEEPDLEDEEDEEEEEEVAITIDGDSWEPYEVDVDYHLHGGAQISMGRIEYIVFADSDAAGQGARDYWEDMARNDPSNFAHMIGQDTLTAWGMGQWAGPGSTQVRSLGEWLDLWLNTPEEHWASYDGNESSVDFVSEELVDDLGFTPTVAYRHN